MSYKNQNAFKFNVIDMSNREMFEHIAWIYQLGNHDTPGIFATKGETFFYRNYQLYYGQESFEQIGPNFLYKIVDGEKQKLSNKTVLHFLTVNIWNTEYFMN